MEQHEKVYKIYAKDKDSEEWKEIYCSWTKPNINNWRNPNRSIQLRECELSSTQKILASREASATKQVQVCQCWACGKMIKYGEDIFSYNDYDYDYDDGIYIKHERYCCSPECAEEGLRDLIHVLEKKDKFSDYDDADWEWVDEFET